jgi:tetratricopeptide (TPR) repeat protein
VQKNTLINFLVTGCFVMVSGCSTLSSVLKTERGVEPELANAKSAPFKKAAVTSAIQADLLYVLLVSEIAGQRGELELALDGYMKAARLTGDTRVAGRAAQIAWFAQRKNESSEAIGIWLKAEPDSLEANRLKLGWLIADKREVEALAQLERLLLLPTAEIEQELVSMAKRLGKLPDKQWALAFMERVADRYEERAEAHYAFALLAFQQGNLAAVSGKLKRARALRPSWVKPMVLESQVRVKEGQFPEAAAVINRALEIEPDNNKLALLQAQLLLASGDLEGAKRAFGLIVEGSPRNYDALYSLALLELRGGEVEAAKKRFESLLAIRKWSTQSSFYLGRIAMKGGFYEEAVEQFDRVAGGGFYLDSQLGVVQAFVKMGRIADARKRLGVLRDRFPEKKNRFNLLEGEILRVSKQYQLAFDFYSKVIERQPNAHALLYARALVAGELGKLDILEEDLLKILSTKPEDVDALNALGYMLASRTERYEEAERYLSRALLLEPNNAAILDSYGWLQFKKGHFEEALSYLRRSFRLNKDAEIAAHLGEVLWVLGRKEQAKEVWQKANKSAPDNKYIRALKERFRGAF